MGELVLDDTRSCYPLPELILYAPIAEEKASGTDRDAEADEKVHAAVVQATEGDKRATVRRVRALAQMSNDRVSDILTRLSTGPDCWLIFFNVTGYS